MKEPFNLWLPIFSVVLFLLKLPVVKTGAFSQKNDN
jgi:hypothetical protein